ncbi:FAD-binding oxidoreductase [Sphingobium sufflavum]|uniref:NAD(P)/FAD-dependent oxidoreductase n=1 Tax=Sphingobium sufflavum TaxID=1129547 RepID=UPI001F1F4F5D|nr:FAD-binding oxidoreductase [Sphingobium sufflavum]MCE7796292.1 FAD-binding oxidoreductase [Sphingobium sufflavum]
MTEPSPLSYWLATAPAFTGGATGDPGGQVDVAIIGGGFTGLSAALALRQSGASVAVLEAGPVIGEASGRNGGQCNNGTHQDYGSLVASLGRDRALAYYHAHVDAVDTVERLVREQGIDCAFRRCGRLKLAAKPMHYAKIEKAYALLKAEIDQNVELITPDRIGTEIGSDQFYGGLLQTTSAQLHVGQFGIGLAEAAAAQGATIFEHAPVTDLTRAPGGWTVTASRGSLRARQVLVATGGAPPQKPFRWFQRRLVGVGSFIIATERLGPALIDRLFPNRRNYVTSRIIGNFFRLTPDDRLIFGGRARFAISGGKSDVKSGAILTDAMRAMFPDLRHARIDHVWGGMVDLTADRLPRAGEQDGLFYAMGYSGHGVQMSVHMGQQMARYMGGDLSANPWADLDWPAIPGHLGKPWFLPAVGAWYKVQDMFK